MTALSPLPGDPGALARAAGRLGAVAAGVAGDRASYRDGSATVTVSVMNSDSAFRLTELHDGMRGVEAELMAVERGGAQVAEALEEYAGQWCRLEDQLEDWRDEVARAERAAEEVGIEGSTPEATTAHQLARITRQSAEDDAHAAKQALLARRDALASMVNAQIGVLDPTWVGISPASIRGASLVGRGAPTDPWEQLASAYSFIAADDTRREKAETGYQVAGAIEGFAEAVGETVTGIAEMARHPVRSAQGLWSLGGALVAHPVDTSAALWHQWWDPFAEDWQTGEYGHAIGTGAWDAVELVVGTKGLGKAGRLSKAGAFGAKARLTAFRALQVRRAHLSRNAVLVGTSHYLFRSEREAAWALAHPMPDHTYRVEFEGLPTDYALDGTGRIAMIRGPTTLDRVDVPVVPDKAYRMRDLLAANGWRKVPGFEGGRRFKNLPGREFDSARLPAFGRDDEEVIYKEFDVDASATRRSDRGVDRLVVGGGRVWYTDDHYKTYVELR